MPENWLDFQRATLAEECAGRDDAQLRQASAQPSELALLGLMKHLTGVERSWFRQVFGQQDAAPLYYSEESPDGDFRTEGDSAAELYAGWCEEIAAARECTANRGLDETAERPDHGEIYSLRWIYLPLIEEYARHDGHADPLRERIDGATGV